MLWPFPGSGGYRQWGHRDNNDDLDSRWDFDDDLDDPAGTSWRYDLLSWNS